MQRLPAMVLLGVIMLLFGPAGAVDLSAARGATPPPEAGVQAALPFALVVAAGHVAPRKLPCPYCPKKQKQNSCVAPCSPAPLAPASDTASLIADVAEVANPPPRLMGIVRPPDPPPPKS